MLFRSGVKEEAQANEELAINYKGDPIEIAFNPNYLIDGLSALGTTYVHMGFSASNRPAVLAGKNSLDGEIEGSYRYLLMPMQFAS